MIALISFIYLPPVLLNSSLIFLVFYLHLKLHPLLLKPPVEGREHDQSQKGRCDNPADDHRCQWFLNLGSGACGKEHRYKSEDGDQRCHQYRWEPSVATCNNCLIEVKTLFAELIYVGDKYHAVQYRHAEEGYKADRSRYAQVLPGDP